MSKLYSLLVGALMVFGSNQVNAQIAPVDSTTSVADKAASLYMVEEGKTLYGEGKMREALIKFRQASVRDKNSWRAVYWISKCHYNMNNYGYSLKYANQAIDLGDDKVNEEIYYTLAQSYHRMGKLDTAIAYYEKSIQLMPRRRVKELLVRHNLEQCQYGLEALKSEPKHNRIHLETEINSGFDDYNVVLADDGKTIYFTSRRSNTTGGGLNPDDERYFEDVYRITYDEETGEWSDATNDLGKINSKGFDALNFISPDGLTGVMTINTTMVDVPTETKVSDIFEIKKNTQNKWNTPKRIDNKSINTSFFDGAASLTADGSTMYFVSDRKGEKKSTDIYMVEKVGKAWGTAKPLPKEINTPGRETTPFITPDGRYLFFSSNGHLGMGGLDIFVCENLGGKWGEPVNLGHGINTVNDDTHFVYSPTLKKAFVAGMEIIGNKASIDIYEIDMSNFEFPKQ